MLKRAFASSALAIFAALSAQAGAADLDEIIYAPRLPETQPVEIGNGWYLRGDLGYSLETSGAATRFTVFDPGPPATYSSSAFDGSGLNSDWSGSIGIGYNFTDYLRADATFDYTNGEFGGATSSAFPCPGFPAGTSCASSDSADFKGYGFMANAYLDLGTVAGLTPYVGAGLGMTQIRWGDLTGRSRCVAGAAACPPAATLAPVTHPGENEWRFTYALMAGISYDLTDNLKLDVGYRYQNIDSGAMFGYDAATQLAGAVGVQAEDEGFEKHEIRAGLRYSLW